MAKKKPLRKDLLKGTDDLLSFPEKVSAFFTGHIRTFKYIGIAAAVVVLVYLGVTTYSGYVNKRGQQAYNEAYYMLADQRRSESKADADTLKETEEQFREVIEKHGWSKAADLAIPQIARIEFKQDNLEESIRLYERFLDHVRGSPRYEALPRLALAACYEKRGDFEKGIAVLKPVADYPETAFEETAMLDLARLYRLDNKPDKEKDILEKFVQKYEASPFLPLVKSRL